MRALLLAPHNDDETLFASLICQREHPHVVVVLRSMLQATGREILGPDGERADARITVDFREREAETQCAMEALDCTWEQWGYPDADPDWLQIQSHLGELHHGWDSYGRVWAPLPEREGGHPHHDAIGRMAGLLWGDNARYYTTYRHGRERSRSGKIVIHSAAWEQRKFRALDCYRSQQRLWSTAHHFDSARADPAEYEAEAAP